MSQRHEPVDPPTAADPADLPAAVGSRPGGEQPAPVAADPVLAAARAVIMAHGPRRATLSEVARQAGVSRMTVYRRFHSFDRLVADLLTAELSDAMASIRRVAPAHTNQREHVQYLVGALTDALAGHPLLRRVLRIDPESMVPLMTTRFGHTQRAAAGVLAPLLAAGMAGRGGDGSIRDADPEVLAQTIVTAAQAYVFAADALDAHPLGGQVRQQWPVMVAGYLTPGGQP